jgi:hypothetical protein
MSARFASLLASLVPAGILQWVKETLLGGARPVPVPVPVRVTRPHGQRRRTRR